MSSSTPLPISIPVPILSYHFDGKGNTGYKGEFKFKKQVYTCRKKEGAQEKGAHDLNSHDPLQESTFDLALEPGIIPPLPSQAHDDLDLLIANTKPVKLFVSYHALSSSFRRFYAALSFVSIPHYVPESSAQQEWKDAIVEK